MISNTSYISHIVILYGGTSHQQLHQISPKTKTPHNHCTPRARPYPRALPCLTMTFAFIVGASAPPDDTSALDDAHLGRALRAFRMPTYP
jgi:hypothetical protein